jgi:hypothetical protein
MHSFTDCIYFWLIDADAPDAPRAFIRTDMTNFGKDNVTVTLEWSQFSDETYSVASVPEPEHMSFTMSTSAQLVLLYDTEYNVTVTATLCGHRNAANLMIYYGNTIINISNAWFFNYYVAIVSIILL